MCLRTAELSAPVTATFWVYKVPAGILPGVARLLQHKAVHVSLDMGILLEAYTLSDLERRLVDLFQDKYVFLCVFQL
jgi:hypothetical protein